MANKHVLNCFIITYPKNANPSETLFSTIRLAKIQKKKNYKDWSHPVSDSIHTKKQNIKALLVGV